MHNAKDDAPPVPFQMNLVLIRVHNAKADAPPALFRAKLVLLQVHNAKVVKLVLILPN